ncbi:MAG: hypothetical protein KAJ10_14480, partial [Thermodesulfovibrionia bacterium]|nr:hypothetical protein [Thermodesulfovibrionia bacterium]
MTKIFCNIIEILFRLLGFIPRKWAVGLANFLGRIVFMVIRKRRKIVIDNLTYAYGHQKNQSEIRILARRICINLMQVIFEIGWSLNLNEKQLVRHFEINGHSNIKEAYEKGKGVLVLTAHFGNWELLCVVGDMLGYPLSIVFRTL